LTNDPLVVKALKAARIEATSINLAIQDGVVAANILYKPGREGQVTIDHPNQKRRFARPKQICLT
jgi:hypothetical protein